MVNIRELLLTILTSFNPAKYDILVARRRRQALWYFCRMVFLVFILTSLLMIPNLFTLPAYLKDEIAKFDQLTVNLEYQQKALVTIPRNQPLLTIDTLNEYENINDGNVLITKNAIFYRVAPFGPSTKIQTAEENNLQGLNILLMMLFIAALPVLLIVIFLYGLLKYLVVILLVAFLGLIIARMLRYGLTFKEVFNISMYAATPLVVLGLLTKPFIASLGYLEYVVFLVYFFLGCMKVGDFEEVHRHSEKKE